MDRTSSSFFSQNVQPPFNPQSFPPNSSLPSARSSSVQSGSVQAITEIGANSLRSENVCIVVEDEDRNQDLISLDSTTTTTTSSTSTIAATSHLDEDLDWDNIGLDFLNRKEVKSFIKTLRDQFLHSTNKRLNQQVRNYFEIHQKRYLKWLEKIDNVESSEEKEELIENCKKQIIIILEKSLRVKLQIQKSTNTQHIKEIFSQKRDCFFNSKKEKFKARSIIEAYADFFPSPNTQSRINSYNLWTSYLNDYCKRRNECYLNFVKHLKNIKNEDCTRLLDRFSLLNREEALVFNSKLQSNYPFLFNLAMEKMNQSPKIRDLSEEDRQVWKREYSDYLDKLKIKIDGNQDFSEEEVVKFRKIENELFEGKAIAPFPNPSSNTTSSKPQQRGNNRPQNQISPDQRFASILSSHLADLNTQTSGQQRPNQALPQTPVKRANTSEPSQDTSKRRRVEDSNPIIPTTVDQLNLEKNLSGWTKGLASLITHYPTDLRKYIVEELVSWENRFKKQENSVEQLQQLQEEKNIIFQRFFLSKQKELKSDISDSEKWMDIDRIWKKNPISMRNENVKINLIARSYELSYSSSASNDFISLKREFNNFYEEINEIDRHFNNYLELISFTSTIVPDNPQLNELFKRYCKLDLQTARLILKKFEFSEYPSYVLLPFQKFMNSIDESLKNSLEYKNLNDKVSVFVKKLQNFQVLLRTQCQNLNDSQKLLKLKKELRDLTTNENSLFKEMKKLQQELESNKANSIPSTQTTTLITEVPIIDLNVNPEQNQNVALMEIDG